MNDLPVPIKVSLATKRIVSYPNLEVLALSSNAVSDLPRSTQPVTDLVVLAWVVLRLAEGRMKDHSESWQPSQ